MQQAKSKMSDALFIRVSKVKACFVSTRKWKPVLMTSEAEDELGIDNLIHPNSEMELPQKNAKERKRTQKNAKSAKRGMKEWLGQEKIQPPFSLSDQPVFLCVLCVLSRPTSDFGLNWVLTFRERQLSLHRLIIESCITRIERD